MKACVKFDDIYILIQGNQEVLTSVSYSVDKVDEDYTKTSMVGQAKSQISEYLQGKRKDFNLALNYEGNDFTKKVLQQMSKVKYGKIISYKNLAIKVKNPMASRAIGNVCNKNKFVIVIPCHRVVKSDGSLGGYQPGLKYKEILLNLEKRNS